MLLKILPTRQEQWHVGRKMTKKINKVYNVLKGTSRVTKYSAQIAHCPALCHGGLGPKQLRME